METSSRSIRPLLVVLALVLAGGVLWLRVESHAPEASEGTSRQAFAAPSGNEGALEISMVAPDGDVESSLEHAPVAPSREPAAEVPLRSSLGRLVVKVSDDGRPVTGALVRLPEDLESWFLGESSALPSFQGRTDERGRARFDVEPIRWAKVVVEVVRDGSVVRYEEGVATPARGGVKTISFEVLAFDEAFSTNLLVVSAAGGRPIRGARIEVLNQTERAVATVETATDGTAVVTMRRGQSLSVSATNYSAAHVPWKALEDGERVLVELRGHATVRGTLSLPPEDFPAELLLDLKEVQKGVERRPWGASEPAPGGGTVYAELLGPGDWEIGDLTVAGKSVALDVRVAVRTPRGVLPLGTARRVKPGETRDLGDPWAGVELVPTVLRYPSGEELRSDALVSLRGPGGDLSVRGGKRLASLLLPVAGWTLSVQEQSLPAPRKSDSGPHLLELKGFGPVAGFVAGGEDANATVWLFKSGAPFTSTRAKRGSFWFDLVPVGAEVGLVAMRSLESLSAEHAVAAAAGMLDVGLELRD